ncbi:MAG: sigma-54-dependent Fis family transcriptional regulator [Myxococcales bacterium]|nr:sigma-54-dependent Fis family transcriptional regulator [Myxococcales bacterium]
MRDLDFQSYDVLVVDDEPDNLDAFRVAFRKSFKLHYAGGADEALAMLPGIEPAVVVADQRMPGTSGIELLREIKSRDSDTFGILLTAYADLDVLIDALNSGAVDRYVQKPWDSKEFAVILRQGIRSFATYRDNRRLREQLAQYAGYLERQQRDPIDFGQIVGRGAEAEALLARVAEVAPTQTPVLVEGEAGTEKDVVARAIHVGSPREERPFVSVTCAAFRGEALERELFGWKRGAFEGAFHDRAGRFELADGGTLALSEPSELSPSLQARLLRVLAAGEVERLGDTTSRPVDVRLVVTVAPTLAEAFAGAPAPLLPELVSRLSVFPLSVPPLAARRGDIPKLAEHFLAKYAARNARAATALDAAAVERLVAYDWPGNARELENVVERAAILARGGVIGPEHLLVQNREPAPRREPRAADAPPSEGSLTLTGRLDAIERRELLAALKQHAGNKAEVARALGIHRTTLYYRLKKLGIEA